MRTRLFADNARLSSLKRRANEKFRTAEWKAATELGESEPVQKENICDERGKVCRRDSSRSIRSMISPQLSESFSQFLCFVWFIYCSNNNSVLISPLRSSLPLRATSFDNIMILLCYLWYDYSEDEVEIEFSSKLERVLLSTFDVLLRLLGEKYRCTGLIKRKRRAKWMEKEKWFRHICIQPNRETAFNQIYITS